MNDRLKFRYWDKNKKEYIKTQCYCLALHWSSFVSVWCAQRDNGTYSTRLGEIYNDMDIIPEQCTGLKDKNGNLIYEGDIVKCDRDFSENGRKNLIRKVIFADGSFQLERAKTIGDRYYINAFHNFEIIGNVHEQAEQKDVK